MGDHKRNALAEMMKNAPPGAVPVRVHRLPEGVNFAGGGMDWSVDEEKRDFVLVVYVTHVKESALVGGGQLQRVTVGELARVPIAEVKAALDKLNAPPQGELVSA